MKNIKILLIVLLLILSPQVWADDVFILDRYQINHLIDQVKGQSLQQKIEKISADFVGKPAEFEPLGEGTQGEFSQRPLYTLRKFSCQTYVETVMALALSNNSKEFIEILNKIRYKDGEISFYTRNHFAVIDWIPNNEKNNYITDVTTQVAGSDNVKKGQVNIELSSWYQHLNSTRIMTTRQLSASQRQELLDKLRLHGQNKIDKIGAVTYIPLNKLLNPQLGIINKIPSGSIILLLRDKWPSKKEFGTHMLVSHMMFAIKKNDGIYLRMATSYGGQTARVQDVPIVEYLKSYRIRPPLGISVFEVKNNGVS